MVDRAPYRNGRKTPRYFSLCNSVHAFTLERSENATDLKQFFDVPVSCTC